MGVSTVGIVMVDNIDVFDVKSRIDNALYQFEVYNPINGNMIRSDVKADYYLRNASIFVGFGISFDPENPKDIEERNLIVHFKAHSDYKDLGEELNGPKLVFNFNNWGHSNQIMRAILKEFKGVGVRYIIPNDCEDFYEEIVD